MVYTLASGVGGAVEQLTRRKLVTIDGSKATSETAIPLMLNINLPDVKAAGVDVRVAKLDGTPIAREIECKDVPNTDDVTLFLSFDTIAGTDSQFYVYWAPGSALTEPATDSTYGSQAVWDANYKIVYLMNDNPAGSSPQLTDSTSNSNDATSSGSMTSGDLVDVEYGKGIDFDGNNDVFTTESNVPLSGADARTIIAVAHPTQVTDGFVLFGMGTAVNYKTFALGVSNSKIYFTGYFRDFAGSTSISTTRMSSAVSYDGSDIIVYYNGSPDGTSPLALDTTLTTGLIGNRAGATNWWPGNIEFISISNIVRSDNYILTIHNNINNPTATGTTPFFKSFGFEQHHRRTPQFI